MPATKERSSSNKKPVLQGKKFKWTKNLETALKKAGETMKDEPYYADFFKK